MVRPKKDKLGYIHYDYHIEETEWVLKNCRDGDVIYCNRDNGTSGDGNTFVLYKGKEWKPHYCNCKHRTLKQLIDEGYNLKYAGHRGDNNKVAWWNDCELLDLFDLAIMNL